MVVALDGGSLDYWRAHPVAFIETALYDPASSKPFVLLPAERDFLENAFKLDSDGRLLYVELVFSAPKKSGKTTLGAIFVIAILLLFGGPFPEAILVANAQEQARGRVFELTRRIIEASPLLRDEAKFTADKITLAGATIQAIPSDAGTAAGSNQTISVFDELWAFDTERDRRLFDEMVPPPRKIACRLTVTYAGFSGEGELLESLYERGLKLPQIAPSLYAGDGMLMAWHHSVIAPWQTPKWIAQMRTSLRPNQFLRLIENRFVRSEASFIDMALYDACVEPGLGAMVTDTSLSVWAAVDASVSGRPPGSAGEAVAV